MWRGRTAWRCLKISAKLTKLTRPTVFASFTDRSSLVTMLVVTIFYSFLLLPTTIGAPQPPIRQFAELGEDAGRLATEAVSTELTIGRPWSEGSREHRFDNPAQTAVVAPSWQTDIGMSQPFLQPDLSSARNRPNLSPVDKSVRNQAGPSNQLPQVAVFSRPANERSMVQPAVDGDTLSLEPSSSAERAMAQTAHSHSIPPSAHLDAFFNFGHTWWKIPEDIDHVPSPWFDSIYASSKRSWQASQRWFSKARPDSDPHLLDGVLNGRFPMFTKWTVFYKIRFPATPENGMKAGEVLVRFNPHVIQYRSFVLPQGTMSVWKTSDNGSRLALLGLYHCPLVFFEKTFLSLPAVEKFQVRFLLPPSGRGSLVLAPIPLNA